MKDMSDMRRQPGVTPRKGTTRWQWGIKPPVDLRHLYSGEWAQRGTLGTSDLREANALAVQLNAQWASRFETQRRELNPTTLEHITPELIANLAQRIRASVLGVDDLLRDDASKAVAVIQLADAVRRVTRPRYLSDHAPSPSESMQALSAIDPKWSKLSGLSPAQLAELAQMNMRHSAAAGSALARRDLEAVMPVVDAQARRLGLRIDWQRDDARPLLVECLKAWRQAKHDLTQRDAGEVVDTPQAPGLPTVGSDRTTPTISTGHSLNDAFESWRDSDPDRPMKTIKAVRSAMTHAQTLLPERTVESLTRADGMAFEAAMKRWADANGRSRTTASNILTNVKSVIGHAYSIGWIDVNPFAGRSIEGQDSEREPWEDADLKKLFGDDLFVLYALPTVARAGKDAAYWLPMLGLFTGARISELAQLWTDDVAETAEAGPVLVLREGKDREQSLKNKASWRRVPVHPELVRLGFLDYWRAVAKHGPGPLWPAVQVSASNGAGGKVSQWFGEFKTRLGFGPELVFHSFRHTVRTRLTAAGLQDAHIDGITGHAGRGEGRRTYTHLTAAHLRPTIEHLKYPGLTLPRVFIAPIWTPTSTKKPSTK